MPNASALPTCRLLAELLIIVAAAVLLSHLARAVIGFPREDAYDFRVDGLLLTIL
ncbi:MAG: hypothetical protein ACK5RC_07975 [Curvibacter sp.]|jgi:hypothetical protein|nr:hypothetical protein [Curvibacter sp.]